MSERKQTYAQRGRDFSFHSLSIVETQLCREHERDFQIQYDPFNVIDNMFCETRACGNGSFWHSKIHPVYDNYFPVDGFFHPKTFDLQNSRGEYPIIEAIKSEELPTLDI